MKAPRPPKSAIGQSHSGRCASIRFSRNRTTAAKKFSTPAASARLHPTHRSPAGSLYLSHAREPSPRGTGCGRQAVARDNRRRPIPAQPTHPNPEIGSSEAGPVRIGSGCADPAAKGVGQQLDWTEGPPTLSRPEQFGPLRHPDRHPDHRACRGRTCACGSGVSRLATRQLNIAASGGRGRRTSAEAGLSASGARPARLQPRAGFLYSKGRARNPLEKQERGSDSCLN
jgi:hypothetical protein